MTTILLRRGTTAEWVAENTILKSGELALETDTLKLKVGDGTTPWASLPYANPNDPIEFPIRTVQGDSGDVRLSLYTLDGVQLELKEIDDDGNVLEPGPTLG